MKQYVRIGMAMALTTGCVSQTEPSRDRAASTEAEMNLRNLQQAVSVFAMNERFENGRVVEQGLPPNLPMTPPLTGLSSTPRAWPSDAAEGWRALQFEPLPVRYSYSVTTEGNIVRLEAMGDLDGDGVRSHYSREGTFNPESHEYTWRDVVITNELE